MYSNIFNNEIKKNEVIEQIRKIYGDALANDILNNNDPLTEFYINNKLIK